MNQAVLEVAQAIADSHDLGLRDVMVRFRRAGVEFRTETKHSVLNDNKDEHVLLGYAYQGLYYPFTDENRVFLEGLVMSAKPPERPPQSRPEEKTEPTAPASG